MLTPIELLPEVPYPVRVIEIPVVQLDDDLPLPSPARPGDAGVDLYARESVTLAPFERAAVATGLTMAIPIGYAGFVLPRSGLAKNAGITCLNAPGLIDSGYRGELAVLLINLDPTATYAVARGDRIAQLVIQPVPAVQWVPVAEGDLDATDRGAGGFGHTGVA